MREEKETSIKSQSRREQGTHSHVRERKRESREVKSRPRSPFKDFGLYLNINGKAVKNK